MPFYYDFTKTHDNAYLRFVRHIYRPLGFQKGYNFPLWVIMGGAMFAFGLARLEYLDINGIFAQNKIVGGDWEYFRSDHYYVGIIMHLACVLPAALLAPWQFLPVIRHKLLLFHRLNGYLCILLLLVGNAGAFMIARHSLGGDVAAQVLIGLLGVYTTVALALAYYNIKRLQLDQHRAWMLRAWIVAGSIISLRLIQRIMMPILSDIGDYYVAVACSSINFVTGSFGPPQGGLYAACQQDPVNGWAAVKVDFNGGAGGTHVDEISAAIDVTFGPAGIIAMFIHAVFVELYIWLTPVERDRLKQVSYERQLARGLKRPGNAGLTAEVWGDATPWRPQQTPAPAEASDGLESDESDESGLKKGRSGLV